MPSTWRELSACLKYWDGKVKCIHTAKYHGKYSKTGKLVSVDELSKKITVRWDEDGTVDSDWSEPTSFEMVNKFPPARDKFQLKPGMAVLCIYDLPERYCKTGVIKSVGYHITVKWDDGHTGDQSWNHSTSFYIIPTSTPQTTSATQTKVAPAPTEVKPSVVVSSFDWDAYNGFTKSAPKLFGAVKKNIDPYTGLPLETKA